MIRRAVSTHLKNLERSTCSAGIGLLLFSILLTLLLRVPYYQHSFTFIDEAWWAQGGKAWVEGKQLYQDLWLDKNPPIFLFCGFLFKLIGVNTIAIHLGALLLAGLVSLGLFLTGWAFFSVQVGGLAAVLYALASTTYYTPRIIGMNTETLMVLHTTAAMGFLLYGVTRAKGIGFCMAGLASSLAVFAKPVAITQMGLFVFCVFLLTRQPLRLRMRFLLLLCLGFLSGSLAIFWYMHAAGILPAWWKQSVIYSLTYVSRIPLTTFFRRLATSTASFAMIFTWLGVLIVYAWKGKNGRGSPQLRIVFWWMLSAFVGVVAGRRFYANYFIQLLPSISLAGAIGLAYLWQQRHELWAKRAMRLSGAALCVAFIWFHVQTFAHWYYLFNPEAHQRVTFWGICREDRETREIADYLKSRTQRTDRIFIWGSKAQIYFLADRDPATPYMDFDIADDVPPNSASVQVRVETAAKLRADLPAYIVSVHHHHRIRNSPYLGAVVKDYYELETNLHGARLYRLRQAPPARVSP